MNLIDSHRTGITGYIGGDGFFALASAHPDWEYTALVRSEAKSTQVTSKYPQVRTVIGDLDSSELIEEEVKNADIVIRMFIPGSSTSLGIYITSLTTQTQTSPIATMLLQLRPLLRVLSTIHPSVRCG